MQATSSHSIAGSLSVWVVDPANLTPFYSLALCEALSKIGDNVRFLTSRFVYDAELSFPAGVHVDEHYFRRFSWLQQHGGAMVRRALRLIGYPLGHRRLVRRAAAERPDVVHLQWSRLPWLDRGLVARLKRLNIPVVHTVHDVEPLYSSSGGRRSLEGVYSRCDALVVHTETNRRELLKRYRSIRAERVQVIPHGPLQAEGCPPGATQQQARAALRIPADARVILHVGNIKRYKGVDLLVDAFPAICRQVPDAYLLLAGRPAAPSDVPDLAKLNGVRSRLRIDFGFIPNKDIWKYYLACDVVALPYRAITQSGVLLSAMAFGKPAVVTNVGGLPEVVEPGQTGWIVPPEDAPALAGALTQALTDPSRLVEMGKRALADVHSRFGWDQIAQRTHAVYVQLKRSARCV